MNDHDVAACGHSNRWTYGPGICLACERDALRLRVAELEAEKEWHPIETAPIQTFVTLALSSEYVPDYRAVEYNCVLTTSNKWIGPESLERNIAYGCYPTHWMHSIKSPDSMAGETDGPCTAVVLVK